MISKVLPPIEYFVTIMVCVTIISVASILTGWDYVVTKHYIDNGYHKKTIPIEEVTSIRTIWVKHDVEGELNGNPSL